MLRKHLLVDIYGEHAPSKTSCKEWFRRFNSGDFDMRDKEREGAPKKFEDAELQALLEEDSCLSLDRLAKELNVDRSTVGKRLYAMEMAKRRKLGAIQIERERHGKTFGHLRDALSITTKEGFSTSYRNWR